MESNYKTVKLTQDEAYSLVSILEEFKDTITYLPNSNKINDNLDDHEKWQLGFIDTVQDKLG
ncbi:MAG: hypothetical protein Unbinned306contig1002_25 [Prokaryotic dsDNA virus sp.]|nr:MAG: hypothetical protein Unbinned306contig1002_25 [Prokaryotic dsDNA virus sp.]|tara:strand:- start:16719 stop:16904 length:186 start_codon:yes stop_codon:yes gene_type:complete